MWCAQDERRRGQLLAVVWVQCYLSSWQREQRVHKYSDRLHKYLMLMLMSTSTSNGLQLTMPSHVFLKIKSLKIHSHVQL